MRKVDKSKILSTEYKAWEENKVGDHPPYTNTTTRNKYYLDILMNLYHCQEGLCAYTEKDIFTDFHNLLKEENWEAGKYNKARPRNEGEVDHFDSSLKSNKAWLWDNLFAVLGKANNEKRTHKIDERLKPDTPDFDPFKLFEYDIDKDVFIPNTTTFQSDSEKNIISDSIFHLGINFVQGHRSRALKPILKQIELGVETWGSIEVREYPTAFEFYKQHFKNNFSST
jgi:hypothetical protein